MLPFHWRRAYYHQWKEWTSLQNFTKAFQLHWNFFVKTIAGYFFMYQFHNDTSTPWFNLLRFCKNHYHRLEKSWRDCVLVPHAKIVSSCRINIIVGDLEFQEIEESRTFEIDGTPRVLNNLLVNIPSGLPRSEYWFNGQWCAILKIQTRACKTTRGKGCSRSLMPMAFSRSLKTRSRAHLWCIFPFLVYKDLIRIERRVAWG